jgi:hypothetical protein
VNTLCIASEFAVGEARFQMNLRRTLARRKKAPNTKHQASDKLQAAKHQRSGQTLGPMKRIGFGA